MPVVVRLRRVLERIAAADGHCDGAAGDREQTVAGVALLEDGRSAADLPVGEEARASAGAPGVASVADGAAGAGAAGVGAAGAGAAGAGAARAGAAGVGARAAGAARRIRARTRNIRRSSQSNMSCPTAKMHE